MAVIFDFDQPVDLTTFTRAQLDDIIFDEVRWFCGVRYCDHFTRLRNYGNFPLFYWRDHWVDVGHTHFICGSCSRKYKNEWKFVKNHATGQPKGLVSSPIYPVPPGEPFNLVRAEKRTATHTHANWPLRHCPPEWAARLIIGK